MRMASVPARPGRAKVGEQDRPGRRSVGWPGHAVLQVPVIELEDWIVTRTRHYDAGFISDDPGFHHAHITVLAPLTSWDVEAIAALAASSKPFDFELDCIKFVRLDDGGMAVLDIVLLHLARVFDHLFSEKVGAVSFLHKGMTFILFIRQYGLNHARLPLIFTGG